MGREEEKNGERQRSWRTKEEERRQAGRNLRKRGRVERKTIVKKRNVEWDKKVKQKERCRG